MVSVTFGFFLILCLKLRIDLANHQILFGALPQSIARFASAFLCGVCFQLFLRRSSRTDLGAVICMVVMLLSLANRWLAEPILLTFGGYILFWFAERPMGRIISNVGIRNDISYGVYLYAYPLQNILVWKLGLTTPILVSVLALTGASLLAFLSWRFIEKPAFKLRSFFLAFAARLTRAA